MREQFDVTVVGAGPNGLTAACVLAAHGLKTVVVEAGAGPGGGTRTAELTLPDFAHDVCSAVHPTGFLSPAFRALQLERHGLEWLHPEYSAAHPLDGEDAVLLTRRVADTAAGTGADAEAYRRLIAPLLSRFEQTLSDVLQPPSLSTSPFNLAHFGLRGIWPATYLARRRFRGRRARALFAGCAAHSILPLDHWGTAAVGLIFMLSGHAASWPVAKGGSRAIGEALARVFQGHGGTLRCHQTITRLADLPESRLKVFAIAPTQVAALAHDALPSAYLRRLSRYRMGPAVFKVDYALTSAIPWRDAACHGASTVHVGGTLEEIARSEADAWNGTSSERPFVMVCQQSHFDSTRAPAGKHTGYAYCHVPFGSKVSALEALERQIERFAPGFKDCVLARRVMGPAEIEAYNPANIGGTITGGAATLSQLLFRPVARLDPYSTPNAALFLASHATPPGGGVHGMCGFNAARSVLRRFKIPFDPMKLPCLPAAPTGTLVP